MPRSTCGTSESTSEHLVGVILEKLGFNVLSKLNSSFSRTLYGRLYSDKVESIWAIFSGFIETNQCEARANRVLRTPTIKAYQPYRSPDCEYREMGSASYFELYRVGPSALADKRNINGNRRVEIITRAVFVLFVVFRPAIISLSSLS